MKKTLILMSKIFFKKYLPPVRHKLVPKLKMHRIYWNLANVIFRISRSRFWCHRLFLLNIYHLFGPNWSQNLKYSEFIEIWPNWYFKYPGLDFNIRIIFINTYRLLGLIGPKIKSSQNLLKFGPFDISNMSISILM